MCFGKIEPTELQNNPFTMIGHDWFLITAEKDGKVNSMTASWGGMGVMWGKNVVFIVIRPQRYTKTFVDGSDCFSLSVLDSSYRKTLNYLGTVSGRDEQKIENSGLTLINDEAAPYFGEANTVFVCKKLFAQQVEPDSFMEQTEPQKWYPGEDYHVMYIAEIETLLVRS